MTPSDAQTAEWQRIVDNATPGPWTVYVGACELHINAESVTVCSLPDAGLDAGVHDADAALIAAAREAVPALLAALRDARAENERLQGLIPAIREGYEAGDQMRRELVDHLSSANDDLVEAEVERDQARRQLAELRARIEALCDEKERAYTSPLLRISEVRAALFPAEEAPSE